MARKRPSMAGRALLAVVLMIGFYVLAIGICVVLIALCWIDSQSGRVHPKLWIIAAITVGVVVWSVWPRRERFPDPGVPLRPQDQPRLWALVEQIARRAEQEAPRHIFLVPEINAFVAERNSRLGFGGERIMGIGLPLLQVLTQPQLESVVAHEFGHFHGGDTRLGPLVYRTRAAIGRTIQNFAKAESLLQKPFEWYGNLYLRATFSVSRAQEFAADALSVQLIGPEPAKTALRRVGEVGPLYDRYLEAEYLPMLNNGVRPPLSEGFERFLGSAKIRELQVEIGESAMQAKGDPYDSHPPLPERLRAVDEVEEPGGAPAEGPPAISLLDGVERLEGDLLVHLTGRDDVRELPAATWSECGAVLAKGWREFAFEHGEAIGGFAVREFPAQAARLEKVAESVDAKIPREHRREAGGWMVAAMLADALARSGFHVDTGPGDPLVLVKGDARIEPFDLGQQLAANELDAAAFAAAIERAGVGERVAGRDAT